MNYEQYEDLIVDLLYIPGVSVNVLPHVAILNEARPTSKPQLFVILHGSTFAEPENLSVMSQLETIKCEVFIRAKSRRGHLGIFDLYEKITSRLLGYKLPGAKTAITLGLFDYVAGIQNNWQYSLSFSFDAYKVEVDKEITTVTLNQVTPKVAHKNNK